MTNPAGIPIKLKTVLCALLLCLSGGVSASSYDPDTGILSVPCLEALINGKPTNVFYTVEMQLTDNALEVVTISKLGNDLSGCSATFDPVSLEYVDLVDEGDDQYEYRATFQGGRSLGVDGVLQQVDLITQDVTVREFDSIDVDLPLAIDTGSLELSLAGGDALPDFIGLLDNKIMIQPGEADAGSYTLRLQWGDMLELVKITVLGQTGGAQIDLSVKPEILPQFSSLNLYSEGSPFNKPIPFDAAVDPDSDTLVQSLVDSLSMVVQVNQYSTPVFFADDMTPRVDVDLPCGEFWELGISKMVDVPIPDWAEPSADTDGETAPVGCGEDSGQDNFMVVLDLDKRCEYDFWQTRKEGDQWVASFGVGINMDGNGVNPGGLSARGSGFSFLGGVIWPDELAAGVINHPLAFSYDFTKAGGPVAPATDSDGITDSEKAIPEGAIIQLDPDFDLASLDLEPYELTIAKAMQQYGMILVDTGGAGGPIGFYAVDPDSVTGNMYADIFTPDEDYVVLENLDLSTLPLRVLKLGPQDAGFQDKLSLNMGSCSAYQ